MASYATDQETDRQAVAGAVRSPNYHEYVHLVRTSDGWRIANALWQGTMTGGDGAG